MKRSDNIEDIYTLSPLQQGILFHTLYDPESEVYFEQLSCNLRGALDTDALRRAWQSVIDRHTILRTAFFWERRDKPLQVVRRKLGLPWEQQDWRGLSPLEQQERFKACLKADRSRGFELTKAPLMRVTLVQLTEDTYHLVWSHHHILLDGWSVALIMNEVFALYDAFSRGKEIALERSHPYRDYIAWLLKQDMSKAESFWRQALKGFRVPTSLMVDSLPANLPSEEEVYDEQETSVSAEATAALKALANRHQLTMNTIVQGAWALLLGCYSGEQDVMFGSVVSGRPASLDGVEAMVGLFINTLPVRVRILQEAMVLSWLGQLQEQQLEMLEYEYSPLVEIQGWSEVGRGQPLFESLLVFENYPVEDSLQQENGSLEADITHMFEKSNYPLALSATPDEKLLLEIAYDCHRFSAGAIKRMLKHLRNLLEAIAANPERRLCDLSFLTRSEQQQVLVEWNETEAENADQSCIHEMIERQARATPDCIAVACEDGMLTYAELNSRANQLAHHLRKQGVGPEVLVHVCMERSPEMILALLAVLKAGGAYVPLDLAYPDERLNLILASGPTPILLTQHRLAGRFSQSRAMHIYLDRDWQQISTQSEGDLINEVYPRCLAYMIYTSGSTGAPKGVGITHGSLMNLVEWHKRAYKCEAADRATQIAGPAFDASVWEIWPYLTIGASIHIANDETRISAGDLVRWMNEEQITISFVPTPVAENVLREEMATGLALRALLVGGDRLSVWPGSGNAFKVFNHYGPTESTVVTTQGEVKCSQETGTESPHIGKPISNTRVYILDPYANPLPAGVAGELNIAGIGLARGYYNSPEMTAEKFVPNPYSDKPGERLYRSGDLVRWMSDGSIEFLGRKDHQVKIRGYRIEPGEIEVTLKQHPAVRDAVVAVDESHGAKRLVAYVVASLEQNQLIASLRSYLKEKLPEYMLPALFVTIDKMPLTPSGKIDRLGLPKPEQVGRDGEEGFVTPRSPVEEVLAEIWAEVLQVDRVGAHDNFFDLGGHSLLATQVVSRVHEILQVRLPLRKVFEAPTLAGLAAALLNSDEQSRIERTAEMLLKVAELSDEEAKNLLEEKLCHIKEGGAK